MTELWYERVQANERLTQGDIITACPLLTWADTTATLTNGRETEVLKSFTRAISADVVIMTQACDLEQNKVSNVVLCPCLPLSIYRQQWEDVMGSKGQTPTPKAWASLCSDIKDGYQWNLTLLNSGTVDGDSIEKCVVDFHDIFTVPRTFLESLVAQRNLPRFRLLPPYREHLSQAFARYFMRVGLPVAISSDW